MLLKEILHHFPFVGYTALRMRAPLSALCQRAAFSVDGG